MVRIPLAGGTARAYVYPRLDSVVAAVNQSPPIDRVLGFDPDYGVLAFVDDKGQPRRLDLRAQEVRTASTQKLASLSTANGSDLYGITPKGTLARITPAGDWSFEPPSAARSVFPQRNGSLVIAGTEAGKTSLWLIRPPDDEVLQVTSLPLVSRVRAQLGDRIYFGVDSGIVGVRLRDLEHVKSIRFQTPVEAMVATPSGDRLYVALKGGNTLSIVDRYSETITGSVELPGAVSSLRMDPLGQYILAQPAIDTDSAWVIGIGSDRMNGSVATQWRNDLPGFGPQGSIVTVRGDDVMIIDARGLTQRATISGGAKDYWYFLSWNGFRPRAAELDRPVTFETADAIAGDTTALPASSDSVPSPPLRDAPGPTMVNPPPGMIPQVKGYIVSFAAVLSEEKANEAAAGIIVNGVRPRVMPNQSGSTTIYRVVLGPYATREEADRVGRDSRRQYWIYEENR